MVYPTVYMAGYLLLRSAQTRSSSPPSPAQPCPALPSPSLVDSGVILVLILLIP